MKKGVGVVVVYNTEANVTNCEPGVKRKVLAYNEDVMMCEVSFEEGAVGNRHSHEHLQTTYVAEGSFEFYVAGEYATVKKGDILLIPGGSEHGVKALDKGVLIDVFNPYRKEFL